MSHDPDHGGWHARPHHHGVVDATIISSQRGLSAVRWSFWGLATTAAFQALVVGLSGSVALLADTIHNFGDAATAIPLGIAFWLARLSKRPHTDTVLSYLKSLRRRSISL